MLRKDSADPKNRTRVYPGTDSIYKSKLWPNGIVPYVFDGFSLVFSENEMWVLFTSHLKIKETKFCN